MNRYTVKNRWGKSVRVVIPTPPPPARTPTDQLKNIIDTIFLNGLNGHAGPEWEHTIQVLLSNHGWTWNEYMAAQTAR